MRVLASTTAGSGHFMPMVPILTACREAGHEVLVACPRSFASTVAGAGFAVAPFDDAPEREWRAVMSRLPGVPPDEANRIVVGEVFGRLDTTAALPGLSSTLQRWRPDLVLRDPSEFASWLLVARWRLPSVRVSISLLSLEPEWSRAAVDALRHLPAAEGLAFAPADLCAGHVLAAAPAMFDPPHEAADVSVHRYREPQADVAAPAAIPQGDAPLVYVTFGTVAASLGVWPAIYRAVLDGLADLAVRVLVTTGAHVDPIDLGALPTRVEIARFVPQDAVLRHTDVMVAHGGFGTVLGGLRAGVPMVLAPLFADHSYNAARIAAVGAGLAVSTSLDPRVVPSGFTDAIRAAVLRLIKDPAPRAVSRSLAEEMTTHPPVTSLVQTLAAMARRRT